jgi:geranylgeranyl transferase type-2 subunit alpha
LVTELDFTKKKIEENFSNYSAFHQRSALLKLAGRSVVQELANELSTVENAVFTEPDDQSAWWYHQFLLNWAKEAVFMGADSGGSLFHSLSLLFCSLTVCVFN